MNARIAVLGATGVYGRHLVPRLVAAGYRVRALVRRPEAAAAGGGVRCRGGRGRHLRRSIVARRARRLRRRDQSRDQPAGAGRAGRDFAKNDQLRREGTPIFVRACRDAGVSRILQQSIAMTHAGGGDAWADETTFHPAGEGIAGAAIAAVRAMEAAVVESISTGSSCAAACSTVPARVSTTTGSRARAPASCGCPRRAMTMSRSCTSRTWRRQLSPRFAAGRRVSR